MKKKFLMKKIFLCAVILGAFFAAGAVAYAATWYPWGPHFFTPHEGKMGAFSNHVSVCGMKWTSNDIQSIINQGGIGFKTLEFEFRPYSNNTGQGTTPVNPNNIWYNDASNISFSSNFPESYYEFQPDDPDDVAVCTRRAANLQANAVYYGTLSLTAKPGITFSNRRVLLESELGAWPVLAQDSLPLMYEQVFNRTSDSDVVSADTYFGSYYEW